MTKIDMHYVRFIWEVWTEITSKDFFFLIPLNKSEELLVNNSEWSLRKNMWIRYQYDAKFIYVQVITIDIICTTILITTIIMTMIKVILIPPRSVKAQNIVGVNWNFNW